MVAGSPPGEWVPIPGLFVRVVAPILILLRMKSKLVPRIYFSDYFGLSPKVLEAYGAFNVSLIRDLPLFIDPFLLFNSTKPEYRHLHDEIIRYVRFLRDQAKVDLDPGLVKAWFTFSEVKQTWLGFSKVGNAGSGLGHTFAASLARNLGALFRTFGDEGQAQITLGSHLEKLCLIEDGVGRDNISDFTTNLIKGYLLRYTQDFARAHLRADQRKRVTVPKVSFNYDTRSWQAEPFDLPFWNNDYIVLTPRDLLTRDQTWINRPDMLAAIPDIVASVPNDQLRAQLNDYFLSRLPPPPKGKKEKEPSKAELRKATADTIRQFPDLIDYYIRAKEEDADGATAVSKKRVQEAEETFLRRLTDFVRALHERTAFYDTGTDTLAEARRRVLFLKSEIEDKDGYRIFYGLDGKPVRREEVVQLLFRLTWFATDASVDREPNNGRGPVDFKISRGAADMSLVEFKLAKNSKLAQNLEHQLPVYKKANNTKKALTVIVAFSPEEFVKAKSIVKRLKLDKDPDIIFINADSTKKTSASKLR